MIYMYLEVFTITTKQKLKTLTFSVFFYNQTYFYSMNFLNKILSFILYRVYIKINLKKIETKSYL